MHFLRRTLAQTATIALGLLAATALHASDSAADSSTAFPARPVRLVVPYPAGGIVDISARIIADELSQQWKQPVLIKNRPGGNGNIGAEVVRKAKPDGYTLLVGSSFLVLNPLTDSATRYRTQDFRPVVELGSAPTVFAVPAALQVNTLAEFIALAKKQPHQLNAAIPGINTSNKLALERLFTHSGIQVESVLYQGQPPYLADLANNRVQIASVTSTLALPFLQTGQLKALAAVSQQRIPALPDVPALPELGLGDVAVDSFSGLFAPKGTPDAIAEKIRLAVDAAHRSPHARGRLAAQHLQLPERKQTPFATVVQDDVQRWTRHFSVTTATQ